jgi:O-antigen/teichoic acid export membrane protein
VAAAYAAGISTLIWNVGVAPTSIRKAIALAATFWPNGKWAFANGLMITLRAQIFPWALAAYAGPSAVAGFQAVMNVSNLTNPVINGLNNAIPQAAAEAASRSSLAAAWEATLGYVMVGAPFVFGYCALVWLVPEEVLKAFYGKSSPYLDLYFSARIIMLATAFNYLAEMICTFLHGIGHGRVAIRMNGSGFGVAVLSLPLVTLYGISGACIALALANIVRLGSGYFIVSRFSFLAGRSAIRI